MKNFLFSIIVAATILSCSKDDDKSACEKVTGVTALRYDGVNWVYEITLDNKQPTPTNKATTDFYKDKQGQCFEGFKE